MYWEGFTLAVCYVLKSSSTDERLFIKLKYSDDDFSNFFSNFLLIYVKSLKF